MYFDYLNLQIIPCIVYCVTSKTTKFKRGVDMYNHNFDTEICDLSVS